MVMFDCRERMHVHVKGLLGVPEDGVLESADFEVKRDTPRQLTRSGARRSARPPLQSILYTRRALPPAIQSR
jgi:hypothetical protein